MSNLPVIGQIRTFKDVQRALESIRSWIIGGGLTSLGTNTTTIIESGSTPTPPVVYTVEDPVYFSSANKIGLLYDGGSLNLVNARILAVNFGIFANIVSCNDETIFHNDNIVYLS